MAFTVLSLALPLLCAGFMVWGWPFALDNDIYFHLRAGMRILDSWGVQKWEDHSYTAAGEINEFVACWLSELFLGVAYRVGGTSGVKVLNFGLVLAVVVLVWRFVQKRAGNGAACLAASVVVLAQREVQVLRPLVFGEVLLAYVALYLFQPLRPFTRKDLLVATGLAVLWANLHGSVVLLPALVLLYAAAVSLAHGKFDRSLTLTLLGPLAVFVGSLVSPLGLHVYSLAWQIGKIGKQIVGNEEWKSPFAAGLFDTDYTGHGILLVAALTLVIAYLRREDGWAERLFFVALNFFFLALASSSVRNVFFFDFPAALCLAYGVPLLAGVRTYTTLAPRYRDLGWFGISLGMLIHYQFYRTDLAVPSLVKTATFIRETQLAGNVFNPPGWGAYLIFRLFPQVKVSVDSRGWVHRSYYQKEKRLYDQYGPRAFLYLLKDAPAETDFILLPGGLAHIDLLPAAEWLRVYENNEAVLFVRRSAKNREAVARIVEYYRRSKVPFDVKNGFQPRSVFESSPTWFVAQWEDSSLGRWPRPGARDIENKRRVSYFQNRGLTDLYAAELMRR